MQSRSLGLQILWWAEVVVGARAFLFFAPVLINRWRAQSLSASSVEDLFFGLATLASLFYFVIGAASLLGHRWGRLFHALAMIAILALTFALWNFTRQAAVPLAPVYLLPAAWAIVMTIFVYGGHHA